MEKRKTPKYRYERKYLLDRETALLLKQRVSFALKPDEMAANGLYRVSTLYFDDIYNTAFFEKQNGILVRDKFRVRYYNNSYDTIRLERKHKHGEMICKEGALIWPEEYELMCRGEFCFMREQAEAVFAQFYKAHATKRLRPVVLVEYDRQAYKHPAGNVRVTFDSDLSASPPLRGRTQGPPLQGLTASPPRQGRTNPHPVLPKEQVILEIKYDNFIPLFITELLSGFQLTQQLPISKFTLSKQAIATPTKC
ncbi:MAG: polyphosphate polymerase domain-containing protein [Lachnospiraceae bacterium]|jgi:hypothetical protein|nr:polyphosphate polymerase domain-containing protein [Lachnospiraceae bacterium]